MNIILGFITSYAVVGIGVALFYLNLCSKYISSQELRDELIFREGEEEGTRIIRTFTQPVKITFGLLFCIMLWPWVLKGYFARD